MNRRGFLGRLAAAALGAAAHCYAPGLLRPVRVFSWATPTMVRDWRFVARVVSIDDVSELS